MRHISSESPTATVYQCEHGGIHLVIRDVNIALNDSEFYNTNEQIQRARMMIDNGYWHCEYVQLTFCKVTLVVQKNELLIVADVMERAEIVMENRINAENVIDIKRANRENTLPNHQKATLRPFFKN